MRKLLSVLFSTLQGGVRGGLLFVALLATTCLWAYEYDFQSGGLYYNITSDTTVEVTYQKFQSSSNYSRVTTLNIPITAIYNGTTYSVTSIGSYAFYGCSSLTSITIPESVTSIGIYAFFDCSSLTKTNYTGDIAGWCNIMFSEYYANPMYYSHNFYINDQEIKNLVIPDSVTSIKAYAFYGCSTLREITLPASLKEVGASAFAGCPRIYEVTCLAPEPPIADESSFTNYDAYFHSYCDAQRYYSVDPMWKKFHNVECIVNENTVTNNVTITPSECEATVVWLSNDAAAAYSLVLTKNGTTFCTLRFNKYGQLTNIAFSPSRTHNNKQQSAEITETGYSFTITGLDAGTRYDYQFSVLNDSNESIDEYFGDFTTHSTTAVDNISSPNADPQKLLRNGQLLILRDGVEYTIMGQKL